MAFNNSVDIRNAGLVSFSSAGVTAGRTITAGNTGVTITNGDGISGNPTITVNGGGMPATNVTGATQTLAVNNSYVTNRGGGVTYTLPSTASLGDIIIITGLSGAWSVAQNDNQSIKVGTSTSTVGVGGSIASTNASDCITLYCVTAGASTVWTSHGIQSAGITVV